MDRVTDKDQIAEEHLPEKSEEDIVEAAVTFINETANKTIYKGSIEIGEYILKHFFNDDIKLASSKNPKKVTSFNKLYEREDLTVHPSRLALMVRVATQERYLTDKNVATDSLSYTHKASLVKLENGVKKTNLIKKCIENKWSTRKLDEEITKTLQNSVPSPNPSLINTTKKYIAKIDGLIKVADDSNLKDADNGLAEMSKSRLQNLEKNLAKLKKKIENNKEIFDNVSRDCDDLLSKVKEVTISKEDGKASIQEGESA